MASRTQICNLALAKLGARRITDLNEGTNESKLCSTFLDDIISEVQTEGVFTSTIRRALINLTTTTPAYGFTKEYQLPTNPKCLRVLSINETKVGITEFRIEGDKLLSNDAISSITYIANITDTGDFDEMLKKVIYYRLAAELAYPITGSATVADRLDQKARQIMEEAKAIDSQNGSNRRIISDDLLDVR